MNSNLCSVGKAGLTIFLLVSLTTMSALAEQVAWVRQFGTSGSDVNGGVAIDALGNIFVSGQTTGSLGSANAGLNDAFIRKYDPAGNVLWTRQLGTSSDDFGAGVATDNLGNVYLAGSTFGDLGGPNLGSVDAFIAKYDSAGSIQWTRQLGTVGNDYGSAISADGHGSVFVSGEVGGDLAGANQGGYDAFVSKYDDAGDLVWNRQVGSHGEDLSNGVSADGLGNVYIAGETGGDLGAPNVGVRDIFLTKYNAAGSRQWTRQAGTAVVDASHAIAADGLGNVFVAGETGGDLAGASAGSLDGFVSKYDANANLIWSRQFGTAQPDEGFAVAADGSGSVYVSGYTTGDLDGPNAGGRDVFVSKYDSGGDLIWSRQFGTDVDDKSGGIAVGGLGNVYLSGETFGNLGGPSTGGKDVFVAKISEAPEARSLALATIGAPMLLLCRRRRNR
jgi:hypothetical protein